MPSVTVTRPANSASAAYIWKKLTVYSDFSWHPSIKASKDIGNVPDGSANMVGAVRLVTGGSGVELTEIVTAWSDADKSQTFEIQGDGLPAPIDTFSFTFTVREEGTQVFIDGIVNVKPKWYFFFLSPLLPLILAKKAAPFVEGIANLVQD